MLMTQRVRFILYLWIILDIKHYREPKFDWDDKELVNRCVRYQNKQVHNQRFDPVEYFGGCTPKTVETGVIRTIVKQMFDNSPPKKRSTCHNYSTIENVKSEQVKAQFNLVNQKSMSKGKLPSFTELSQSFKDSQTRIRNLIKNKSILSVIIRNE